MDKKSGNMEEPLFIKLEGGNRRKRVDYSAAREDFLGPMTQRETATTGQRMAAVRDANRSGRRVIPEDDDGFTGRQTEASDPRRRSSSAGSSRPVSRRQQERMQRKQEGVSVVPLFNMIRKYFRSRDMGDNYVMGALGAAVGVLAACIVGIIVTTFIPRLYGVISTLVPVWACVGYMTFNGRRGKSKVPVIMVLIFSFLGVLTIGFGSDIFAPALGSGMTLKRSMHLFKGNIGDGQYWLNSIGQALIPMVFVLIGMAMSMPRILHRPVKKKNVHRKTA